MIKKFVLSEEKGTQWRQQWLAKYLSTDALGLVSANLCSRQANSMFAAW